jgi:hypothetical protein
MFIFSFVSSHFELKSLGSTTLEMIYFFVLYFGLIE